MKTLRTLTAAGAVVLAGSALAADLPRRAPAPYIAPPPVFTWTGFYIGLNAGAAIQNRSDNNTFNNLLLANTLGVNPIFLTNFNGSDRVAAIAGGQMGYNFQTGPVVFGLEVDAQYRSSFGQNRNGFFGAGQNNRNNDGFLGTARARLGYSFAAPFLVYVTGGAAFGNTFGSNSFNSFPFGFGGAGFGFNGNNNNNFRVGYTVGGGLEYSISPNWSIKTEYLFVDLGRGNNNNGTFFGNNGGNRSQAHIARVGVNYRFNFAAPAPVVARY